MSDYTARQKRLCAQRELARREADYPRYVVRGQLGPYQAEQEIACMREICSDYAEQEKLEAVDAADFANRDPAWGGR